jgi:predicted dehydrogenase
MTLRIAFVGAGTVAHLHAAALSHTPGVELVGIHDKDDGRAELLADLFGTRVINRVDALLADESIDAVYVLTPARSHVPIAMACLDAGKHVLVEKPVATSASEIIQLAQHAENLGLTAAPGHNYVYLPECARLIRLAREGVLGDVRALFVTYAIKHAEGMAALYDGVLDEVMVHHASIALAVLGEPARVSGGVSKPAWRELETDDQAWMVWEYGTGATALLFASFAVDDMSAEPLTFATKTLGTAGSSGFTWRGSTTTGGPFTVGIPLYEETYVYEAAAFRDAVCDRAPLLSTLSDAAKAAEIISQVHSQQAPPQWPQRLDSGDAR